MKRNDMLRALLIMLIIVGVTVGSAFLLDIPTSKVIEQRELEKVKEYLVYFEGAEGLKDITEDVNPASTSGVEKVLEETSGKGYVVEVYKKGFSKDVKVIVTISNEGVVLNIHAEIGAGDFAADATIESVLGQNSTLADVVMTSGATVSSTAVKEAVAAAFQVLIDSEKIKEAVKSDEQILEELIPTVNAGFEKGAALTTTTDVYKAYNSKDGKLVVCHVKVNEQPLMAIADENGNVKVYALAGEALSDVTSANGNVVTLVGEYLAMLELESLKAVLPSATGFEEITSTLTLGSEISAVYKDVAGTGYVIIATAPGFQGHPVTVTVGITKDGLVAGLTSEVTSGDWDILEENTQSFIGQDSTLSGVILTGKATSSATGVKNAVNNAFLVLSSNGLLKAAAKETEQVFEEKLETVISGFVKDEKSTLTPSGNIYTAYKALNGSVVVSYVNVDDQKLLAVTNIQGLTKVYKTNLLNEDTQEYNLVEVTSLYADVVSEVTAFATPIFSSQLNRLTKKVQNLYKVDGNVLATDIQEVEITTMSTLLSAVSFTYEGATYYATYSKEYSYNKEMMDVYVILDSEGKIVKVDINKFFFEETYFLDKPAFDKNEYLGGFPGLDEDTLGDSTLVSGATLSSSAVKQAINDAFALFASKGGNN